MFFQLEPILYLTCLVLAVIPILLFWGFASRGRHRKMHELGATIKSNQKLSEFSGPAKPDIQNPEMLLRDFLMKRYWDLQELKNYLLPLFLFHVVYLFGLVWSFICFGFLLKEPSEQLWSTVNNKIYQQATFASAGFTGAVLIMLWYLFWRVMLVDIKPRTFIHFTAKMVAAPILAIVVANVFKGANESVALFLAFGAGMFTNAAFRIVETRWRKLVKATTSQERSLPLRSLDGMEPNDVLRLWEEGVTDAQHLAVKSVEDLLTSTNYSLEQIVDWKDQAFLYIYVGDELEKWRKLHIRAALDVLGLAEKYYAQHHDAMRASIAKALDKDEAVIERFIDTVWQDPRVHQLWNYIAAAYPMKVAESIVAGTLPPPSPPPPPASTAPTSRRRQSAKSRKTKKRMGK